MTITLKQGDCLELMKELPDEAFALVYAEPWLAVYRAIRYDSGAAFAGFCHGVVLLSPVLAEYGAV